MGLKMDVIVADHFADKQGDTFTIVQGDDVSLSLTLDAIEARPVIDFVGKIRDPFSLIFSGTQGYCCEQGNYQLRHGSGWEIEVFLVPIAELPDHRFQYQAIYS